MGPAPTAEQVGDLEPDWAISLTVSCCLRQPRIASGATHDLYFVVRDFHLRGTRAFLLKCDVSLVREPGFQHCRTSRQMAPGQLIR